MTRWILVLVLLAAGCRRAPATARPAPLPDAALLGGAVGEGVRRLGLTLEERPVIEEPPGICRGIRGKDAKGSEIWLYVDRHALGFREKASFQVEEILVLPVVGIARRVAKGWATTGAVIPYYHSR